MKTRFYILAFVFSMMSGLISCDNTPIQYASFWIEDAPDLQPFVNVIQIDEFDTGSFNITLIMILKHEEINEVVIDKFTLKDNCLEFEIPDMKLSFKGNFSKNKLKGEFILPDGSEQAFVSNRATLEDLETLKREMIPAR